MPTIQFIKNNDLYYPRSEDDYSALKAMRVPVRTFDKSSLLYLSRNLPPRHITLSILPFEDEEARMLEKLGRHVSHQVHATDKTVVLLCHRKTNPDSLERVVALILDWYRKRYCTPTMVQRRSSKALRVTIHKGRP